jgi:sulfatase modifying factor 1
VKKLRYPAIALVAALLLVGAWLLWPRASAGVQADALAPQQCALPQEPTASPHPGMVWVPAGTFALGDTVYAEEQPVRPATVKGFWMDRTEVTNAQFARFIQATGYVTLAERPVDTKLHPGLPPDMQQPGAVVFINPADVRNGGDLRQWWQYVPGASWRHPGGPATSIEGRDAFPVVNVTQEDAQAYARWAGRALPSEVEWEWAARGGLAENNDRSQPTQANTWQGVFPVSNQASDGFTALAPVGCFAPNGFALLDMIGNVWELTADRYTERHGAENNIPPDQPPVAQRPGAEPGRHVIKGGSYLCAPNYCMRYRPGARQPQEDDLATAHVGFRTVLRATGP